MERFANFHRIVKIKDNIELPSPEVEFHCPDLMTRHARPGNGGRGFSLQHVPSLRELMKILTVTANRIFDGLVRKTRRIIPVHYTDNNLLSVDTVVVKFEEATRLWCGGSKYCDDDKYRLWRCQLFHRERMTTILSSHTPSRLDTVYSEDSVHLQTAHRMLFMISLKCCKHAALILISFSIKHLYIGA